VQAEQGLRHPGDLTPRAHGARGAGLRALLSADAWGKGGLVRFTTMVNVRTHFLFFFRLAKLRFWQQRHQGSRCSCGEEPRLRVCPPSPCERRAARPMAARGEAFVEYQRPGLSGRTHKSSLDLPAPPACGRSSPDMRPARWSSHGHIRFRRDDVDDPAWRREQVRCWGKVPDVRRGRRELTARPAVARSSPPRGWRRSACARHGGSPTKRSSSKRSAAGQRAGAPRALPPPTRPAPAALALSQCAAVGPFCCADPSRGACCRGYLTSVILGTAPESPCAYPPGWRRSTGLKVTGSARDPVDEAAVKLAFLGFPWQYAYYGAPPPCASTLRHAGACSEPFRGL